MNLLIFFDIMKNGRSKSLRILDNFLQFYDRGPCCLYEIHFISFSVQDIVFQLQRLVSAMSKYHNDCHSVLKEADVFPIEVDLSRSTFTYDKSNEFNDDGEDEEEDDDELEGCRGDGGALWR